MLSQDFTEIISSFLVFSLLLSSSANAQQTALVSIDPVVRHPVTQTIPVLSRLVAKKSGTVSTRIAGTISEIRVSLGSEVNKDQVLARIDAKNLDLQRRQAELLLTESQTRLKTTNAQLALASQEVKRLAGLTDSAAVSQATYDDARQQQNIAIARASEAEASINSSRAKLEIADLNLSYVEIRASFNGTITEKLTEVGNYVQPGDPLFHIISDKDLELEADIPASLIHGLSDIGEVKIVLENGSQHSATLRAIIPEENPRTRTRRVRFTTVFEDSAGVLASDQSAIIHIPVSAAREVISVHKDGVIRRGENNIVYIVSQDQQGNSIAELRVIQTGTAVDNRVEVLDGISENQQVIILGNERLQPGQPIRVANAQ